MPAWEAGGAPVHDPGDDRDAVEHAIPIAWEHRVIVSPIVEVGRVWLLAWALADGGALGGAVLDIADPNLASKLVDHIRSTCPAPWARILWVFHPPQGGFRCL